MEVLIENTVKTMIVKKEHRFSIFEALNGVSGAYQTTPTQTLNFNELLEYYNSPDNKKLSEAILNAPTPEAKNNLKSKRAYYTPYGIFSTRKTYERKTTDYRCS